MKSLFIVGACAAFAVIVCGRKTTKLFVQKSSASVSLGKVIDRSYF